VGRLEKPGFEACHGVATSPRSLPTRRRQIVYGYVSVRELKPPRCQAPARFDRGASKRRAFRWGARRTHKGRDGECSRLTRQELLEVGTGPAFPRDSGGGRGHIKERIGPLPTSQMSEDTTRYDGKLSKKGRRQMHHDWGSWARRLLASVSGDFPEPAATDRVLLRQGA
jgi:hypothetical protein